MIFEQTSKIEHDLHPHFPEFLTHHSTKSLEESKLYQDLKSRIVKVLNSFEMESLAPAAEPEPYYRCVAWNIERGMCWEAILHFLKEHPILSKADVLLITEADLGMARSGNRNVAREIAKELGMNYFFAPSYLNLAKGCGIENDVEGENALGIHGNAILSRYPISKPEVISLPNAHDKMKGREKRLGNQRPLLATVDLGGKPVQFACAHIDVRSTQNRRKLQLEEVIDGLNANPDLPSLVGGDWNTSTYDSHSSRSAIIGFWFRVLMGIDNMLKNHYPYPDRRFEKKLFRMLEEKGFDYRGCNELGATTNHYSVKDIKQVKNLGEWVPLWCFRFIEWSLKNNDGICSFKLDWFAQKKLKVLQANEVTSNLKGPSTPPKVVGNLVHQNVLASDHDAIVLDFTV